MRLSNEPLYYPSFQSRQESYRNLRLHCVRFRVQERISVFRGFRTKMSLGVDNVPLGGADVDERNVQSKIVRSTKSSDLVLACIKTVFLCSIFYKSNFQFL